MRHLLSSALSRARESAYRQLASVPPMCSGVTTSKPAMPRRWWSKTLIDSGGQLIDPASSYGDAERVLGNVIANEGFRDKVFVATKLEAPDAAELKRSLSQLKTAKLDLLQLHNVRNRRQSLAQFKAWKSQGVCRYVGVTSTFHGDFPAMEAVIAREHPDFVQIVLTRRP